jgi:hypothetical protein
VLNVLLLAPGWMQVTHLALAIGIWLVLVLAWMASSEAGTTRSTSQGGASSRANGTDDLPGSAELAP